MSDEFYFKFIEDEFYFTLNSTQVETFLDNSSWSKYKLQKEMIKVAIESRLVKNNDYVLCVLYGNRQRREFFDFQVGASETYKFREVDKSAFERCLGEELGVRYNKDNRPFITKHKNINYAVVNISDTRPINKSKPEFKSIDDENKKMYCFIYGNVKDIKKFLENDLILDKSSDTIVGLVAISFADIRQHFKL